MIKSTLCYIEQDECYLMLLRNRKKNDCNEGKWIGVGGKFEEGETPEQCMLREVKEETGLTLKSWHFYGIIEFRSDGWEYEDMYLFGSNEFEGVPDYNCNEGELRFIPKNEIMKLNLWEGDRLFLKDMLDGKKKINMTLRYTGDKLIP